MINAQPVEGSFSRGPVPIPSLGSGRSSHGHYGAVLGKRHTRFAGFLAAAAIAARIAGRLTGIALSMGLGVTWGVVALIEVATSSQVRLSGVIVLVYVIVATLYGQWLGTRMERRAVHSAH